MKRAWLGHCAIGICLALLLVAPVAAVGSSSGPYLTTSVKLYGVALKTVSGYVGIEASLNSTLGSPTSVGVFLTVANAAGQTVYVTYIFTLSFKSGHPLTDFFGLPLSELAHGNYTASVMATTAEGVPLSTMVTTEFII